MKIGRKALEQLLLATKREQNINGKNQSQVTSCVLSIKDGLVSTTCIVKDGKTSLSRFSFKTDGEGELSIPVPEIERMLGVLKFHGDYVQFKYENGKVRIRSNKKQTTLVGGFEAKAYANSQHTIEKYNEMAIERAKQIKDNVYIIKDGDTITPFFTVTLTAADLHDAVRCDGMNGQKLNRYRFKSNGEELSVSVGDIYKGLTETVVAENYAGKEFAASFEGGLENIFKHYSGNVKVSFLDFSAYGQGVRMILNFDNGDWVFQAGVL